MTTLPAKELAEVRKRAKQIKLAIKNCDDLAERLHKNGHSECARIEERKAAKLKAMLVRLEKVGA